MSDRITSPFGYRATAMEVVQGHDLRGKSVIITGGAAGIGLETTRALLAAGADVLLGVRDPAGAEPALRELRESTGRDRLRAERLDLASLASVRRFAAEYLRGEQPLHILINNAGVMATPLSRTDDGFELQFGTNHLGHFALTALLLPALLAGAPARVVAVSSGGHRSSDIDFDDVNYQRRPYDKWKAYGQSKTANVLHAVGLTRRYGAQGICANALMPGAIMTGLQKFLPREEMQAMGWLKDNGEPLDLFKTPQQGAATSVWAAVGAELEGIGGRYLEDCQEAPPWQPERPYSGYKAYAVSPESADRLWGLSEELTGLRPAT